MVMGDYSVVLRFILFLQPVVLRPAVLYAAVVPSLVMVMVSIIGVGDEDNANAETDENDEKNTSFNPFACFSPEKELNRYLRLIFVIEAGKKL